MSEPILVIKDLDKSFPGVHALDHVSLEVRPHEVVGLIGENGAGKSTVLKVLAGLYAADSGTVRLRGKPVVYRTITQAMNAGIGMVFQEQSLIPNISVAENILLGAERGGIKHGIYRWKDLYRHAQVQLDKIGSRIDARSLTETLSFSERQMVELAKVLAIEERTNEEPVILLDEPTSVLEKEEIATLFGQIRRLREIASVIFVSHRLDEVLEVSDRVYVMRNGQVVAERDPKHCDLGELYSLMVGRALSGNYYREDQQVPYDESKTRLEVKGLSLPGRYEDVSFAVHAGEVLGLTGVQGSGCEAVCRTLFGALDQGSGQITLDGKIARFGTPADAKDRGIGNVPAERRVEGLVMGMRLDRNTTLAHLRVVQNGPIVSQRKEGALVREWVTRLGIKTPSLKTPARNLSGGNQQKVALSKWLISEGLKVLILDHPTRGLDVGAKAEVYDLVRTLASEGIAIVLLADTLEETIGLSHNIVIMKDGQISARLAAPAGDKPTQVAIVKRMV
jgi:ribose transport system ATP-binding protein